MPSNKKSIINQDTITPGGWVVTDEPIVPNGEKWIITEFGAADINLGNNRSSAFILMYGGEILDGAIIVATGQSVAQRPASGWELLGDGVKRVQVMRRNFDTAAKQLPYWITAYQRS